MNENLIISEAYKIQKFRKIEVIDVIFSVKTTKTNDGYYCGNCSVHHLKNPPDKCNHKTYEGNCSLRSCQEIDEREWLDNESLKRVV